MKKTYIIPTTTDMLMVCEQLMQGEGLGVLIGSGKQFDDQSMIE